MRKFFLTSAILISSVSTTAFGQTCSEWLEKKQGTCMSCFNGRGGIGQTQELLDAATDYVKSNFNDLSTQQLIVDFRKKLNDCNAANTWGLDELAQFLSDLNEFGVEIGLCQEWYNYADVGSIYNNLRDKLAKQTQERNSKLVEKLKTRMNARKIRMEKDQHKTGTEG